MRVQCVTTTVPTSIIRLRVFKPIMSGRPRRLDPLFALGILAIIGIYALTFYRPLTDSMERAEISMMKRVIQPRSKDDHKPGMAWIC